MDLVTQLIDFILHIDVHLKQLIVDYGTATYLILFTIIFMETGFVVTPFLPGDSLLFAAGALSADGKFDVMLLWLLLWSAAVAGDNVNYWVGRFLGPKVFHYEDSRFFKKAHLEKTHAYFEKYGGKTLVMARFMPFVRTFAPFVAGVGRMTYAKFLAFSVAGGCLWMSIFVFGGYYFGNLPYVQKNFKIVILAVIAISLMPMVIEWWRHKRAQAEAAT